MLGNSEQIRKRKMKNSWQEVCYQWRCERVKKMNPRLRSIAAEELSL
jgi:hypothetical protein